MAGYGYKSQGMSNNAMLAYRNGERPWGKWQKQDILYYLKKEGVKWDNYCEMETEELRKKFLVPTLSHHVGKVYKSTMFYKIKV